MEESTTIQRQITEEAVREKFGFEESKIVCLEQNGWFLVLGDDDIGMLLHFDTPSPICKVKLDQTGNRLLLAADILHKELQFEDPLVEDGWFYPEELKKLHPRAELVKESTIVGERTIKIKLRKPGEDWQEWEILETDAKKLRS